jgi:GT2 family glycosyltransferase
LEISDTELIVVDDASEKKDAEENKKACDLYGAKYIRLESRFGAAFARNCGVNSSTGGWIAFLDDDVRVEKGWYRRCRDIVEKTPDETIGIEGRVIPEGNGLWDREVSNENGGQYLTCHIMYRSEVLKRIGGFDEHFNSEIPSCEDHELVSRMLRWGPVKFEPSLAVTHSARQVNLRRYLLQSLRRIHSQLEAEYYFFSKQKDMYHLFRYCTTFFGTYRAILFKHTWTSLHRRPGSRFKRHPLQYAVLHCSCVVEQVYAWLLLPTFVWRYFVRWPSFFSENIDPIRTTDFWKFGEVKPSIYYRMSASILREIAFPVARRPVYTAVSFLRAQSTPLPKRCFIRIDDVFLDKPQSVKRLCDIMAERKAPFLAAVIGSQLSDKQFAGSIKAILAAGGEIALHGFVHKGKFGPYNSEILQLPFQNLSTRVEESLATVQDGPRPFVFMPPFNAINRDQILFLGRYFKVICGGPETARFTDKTFGPVALSNGTWYVPTFYPFYQNASAIIRTRAFAKYGPLGCNICYGVHLCDEIKNGFRDFEKLIDRIAGNLTSWKVFLDGADTPDYGGSP